MPMQHKQQEQDEVSASKIDIDIDRGRDGMRDGRTLNGLIKTYRNCGLRLLCFMNGTLENANESPMKRHA